MGISKRTTLSLLTDRQCLRSAEQIQMPGTPEPRKVRASVAGAGQVVRFKQEKSRSTVGAAAFELQIAAVIERPSRGCMGFLQRSVLNLNRMTLVVGGSGDL
jgi:hypothetical protein